MEVTGVTAMADARSTSSPAASCSGSGWPPASRRTPASCSSTSRPPTSTCATRWRSSTWSRDLADDHGVAVGVVLHDLDQAAAVADHVVLLRPGPRRRGRAARRGAHRRGAHRDLRHPHRGPRRRRRRGPHPPGRPAHATASAGTQPHALAPAYPSPRPPRGHPVMPTFRPSRRPALARRRRPLAARRLRHHRGRRRRRRPTAARRRGRPGHRHGRPRQGRHARRPGHQGRRLEWGRGREPAHASGVSRSASPTRATTPGTPRPSSTRRSPDVGIRGEPSVDAIVALEPRPRRGREGHRPRSRRLRRSRSSARHRARGSDADAQPSARCATTSR